MCLFPSEGTRCEHPRCEHRVYRDPPFRRPPSSVERLQYSSFKNRPHSRKIMRLIEGRKPEETSGVTHEAGPVVRNDIGSTRKESILIDHNVNSISTDTPAPSVIFWKTKGMYLYGIFFLPFQRTKLFSFCPKDKKLCFSLKAIQNSNDFL